MKFDTKPGRNTTRLFVLHALVVTAVLAGLILVQHGMVQHGPDRYGAGPVPLEDAAPPVCVALLAWACAGVAHHIGLLDGERSEGPPHTTQDAYTRSARAARGGSP